MNRTKKVSRLIKRFDLSHPWGSWFLVFGYVMALYFLVFNRTSPFLWFGLGLSSITLFLRPRNEVIEETVNLEDLQKTGFELLTEYLKTWWDKLPSKESKA